MDAIEENSPRSYSTGHLHFVLGLCALGAIAVLALGILPGVWGWGEALILVGLSSLATLSITPEIAHYRTYGRVKRLLALFLILQIAAGIVVGAFLVDKISAFQREVWTPSGFSTGQRIDEIFKMMIGVSEAQSLLPIVAWMIAFHGVFLSAMTGISTWVIAPSTVLVVLGFLWNRNQPVGVLGYTFVFLIVVCVGLEGAASNARKGRLRGLPPSMFSGRGRELLVISLAALLVAPLVPDLRGLTPIERIWNLNTSGTAGETQGILRFSTLYQFVGDVRPDFSPAFLVRSSAALYWRGLVFDRYTGREFKVESENVSLCGSGDLLPSSFSELGDLIKEVEQDYTLLASFPGLLFSAYEPRMVKGFESFWVTKSSVLLTSGSNSKGTAYIVLSEVVIPEPDILRETGLAEEADPRYLQLPESLPERVDDLARELTKDLDNPFDRTVAIAQHLKTLRYDLGVPTIPPGRDVVDYFLFDLQAGYCQHFAAAMAVLCREVGIPARVVTGFGSGSYDSSEHAYRVLQLNFHAWVEVQFEGFGWVTFDPTTGGVGGPDVLDDAERNSILGGTLPYHGRIEKRPTAIYVTDGPDYVTGEIQFLIEGVVLEGGGDSKGVPRVPINVTLDVKGLDIFPVMVMPKDTVSILMLETRTGSEGSFSALCMLPTGVDRVATEARVQVICEGDEMHEPSTTNLTIPIRKRTTIQLSVRNVPETQVVATLKGTGGPMSGQEVEIFLDRVRVGAYTTNNSGMISVGIETDSGPHVVGARYLGNGTIGPASATLSFRITSTTDEQDEKYKLWRWAIVIIASLVAAFVLAFMALRRDRIKSQHQSIAQLYRRMLGTLSRAGINRPENMTPYEFASFVEERGVRGYKEVRSITERFVEGIYEGRALAPEDLSEVRGILDDLPRNLEQRQSILDDARRWIGSFLSDLLPRRAG